MLVSHVLRCAICPFPRFEVPSRGLIILLSSLEDFGSSPTRPPDDVTRRILVRYFSRLGVRYFSRLGVVGCSRTVRSERTVRLDGADGAVCTISARSVRLDGAVSAVGTVGAVHRFNDMLPGMHA